MGPMLFLVMLAPFTVNGFALREAFFVSFLGQLGVDAEKCLRDGLPLDISCCHARFRSPAP